MNRREFLGALAAASLQAQTAARKPNIILILADDLGYGDLGCYGQKRIQTPNIDRLAAEGLRFTQAYAGSTVCAPSRCALMTGFHIGHAYVRGNAPGDTPIRPTDLTFTEFLKKAGYRTALFGKWSLGGIGTTGYPTIRGFDEWFGFFSQSHAHNYYPELLLDGNQALLLRGNTGTRKDEYAHDLFTNRALSFLDRAGSEPFFLKVSYTIPHANNEMGRDTGDGMEVPEDAPYSDQPWPQQEKNFAAMITRMDRDIGRMVEILKQRKLDENTLVLFTSDNGPHKEGGHDPDFFGSRGPLRGIKRDLYEGGIRVPAIARWPTRIKPGRVSDHPWAFWDIFPTFTELAGIDAPAGLDGISFVPELLGKPQKRHEFMYWEFHERRFAQAVRMGDWKAVRYGLDGALELYNLKEDLGETHNIAANHPDIVARVEAYLKTARTESELFPVKAG